MSCSATSDHKDKDKGNNSNKDEEKIKNQPLAFSSSPNLVSATSRLVLKTKSSVSHKDTFLNIELFDPSANKSNESSDSCSSPVTTPILFFLHGICESAETVSVQNIFQHAEQVGIRVAVVELEGHGLSSGKRGLCRDFTTLLLQTIESVSFVLSNSTQEKEGDGNVSKNDIPYAICGASMGGTLAIYAAEIISRILHDVSYDDLIKTSSSLPTTLFFPNNFLGVVPISPAVGVKPEALPPKPIVWALSMASALSPLSRPSLTPLEEPIHYNCPSDTQRNYSGHWPLGTSKMLLDLTAHKVPRDVSQKKLTLEHVKTVMVLVGEKDEVIPVESCQTFYDSLGCGEDNKDMKVLKKGGHDLLVNSKFSQLTLEYLFSLFVVEA